MSNASDEMSPGGSRMLRHGAWMAAKRPAYRQASALKPGKGGAVLLDACACAGNNDIYVPGRANAARQSLGLF